MIGEGNHVTQQCPACGHTVDSVWRSEGEHPTPEEGDLSVCIQCAAGLEFQKDGTLVVVDIATLAPADRLLLERTQAQVRSCWPETRFDQFLGKICKSLES